MLYAIRGFWGISSMNVALSVWMDKSLFRAKIGDGKRDA